MSEGNTFTQEFMLPIATVRAAATQGAAITLEVLNPRGEVPPPPTVGIQPRVKELAGKKIGLCDNGKFGARNLLDAIEAQLRQQYPTAEILRLPKPAAQTITLTPDWYPEVAAQVDTFILATGD